jgi:hypothetical protein
MHVLKTIEDNRYRTDNSTSNAGLNACSGPGEMPNPVESPVAHSLIGPACSTPANNTHGIAAKAIALLSIISSDTFRRDMAMSLQKVGDSDSSKDHHHAIHLLQSYSIEAARSAFCQGMGMHLERAPVHRSGLDTGICVALLKAEQSRTSNSSPHEDLDTAKMLMAKHYSIEHQCLLDLTTARIALDEGNVAEGMRCAAHGQQLARNAHYRLLEVDLTCEVARAHMISHHPQAAPAALHAMTIADAPECGYVWGGCYAAAVLAVHKHRTHAHDALDALKDFRRRLAPLKGNPWLEAALRLVGTEDFPTQDSAHGA